MEETNILSIYKMNSIALARHHKKHCEGEECVISLNILRQMAESAGVKFTDREIEFFI